MARLGSRRIWKQGAESSGALADGFPALDSDALNWDEMPQVGTSFHQSLFEDRAGEGDIGDLEALLGPDGAGLFPPSGLESDASLDGGEAGSVHYY